jgi:hypothetical protein
VSGEGMTSWDAVRALGLVAVALAGCVERDDEPAELLVPADVEVRWAAAWNGVDDGLAAAVPVDVMVYGARSGEPVAGVALRVRIEPESAAEGILLAPEAAVGAVGALREDCARCWWDAWRDAFVEVDAAALQPDLTLTTDANGLARAYVVVDAASGEEGAFAPATVTVVGAGHGESFDVVLR